MVQLPLRYSRARVVEEEEGAVAPPWMSGTWWLWWWWEEGKRVEGSDMVLIWHQIIGLVLTLCDMKNMVIIEMRRKGGFVREMRSR